MKACMNTLQLSLQKKLCFPYFAGEIGMFVGAIKQNDPTRQYHGYLNKEESQSKIIYNVFKHGDQAFVSGKLWMGVL